jgi:hypothetical protein
MHFSWEWETGYEAVSATTADVGGCEFALEDAASARPLPPL